MGESELKAGDRVRLTRLAVDAAVGGYTKPERLGTVLRLSNQRRGGWARRSHQQLVVVRWDGSQSGTTYGEPFLERVASL